MVDTNDKGTENDKDEEMLEAFSLPKRMETIQASRTSPIWSVCNKTDNALVG